LYGGIPDHYLARDQTKGRRIIAQLWPVTNFVVILSLVGWMDQYPESKEERQ